MFIIILYIIIYLYLYIIIFIYIIIIYIVMCPKNGTIFMLRVPKWDFYFFVLVYVYMDNGVLVESTHGGVFGGDFAASCFYILRIVDFI